MGTKAPLQEGTRGQAASSFFGGVFRFIGGMFRGSGKKTAQKAAQAARNKAQRDLASKALPKPKPHAPVPKPHMPKPKPQVPAPKPKLNPARRAALEAAKKSTQKGFLKRMKDLCRKHPKKCKLLRWMGYGAAAFGAYELYDRYGPEAEGGAEGATGTASAGAEGTGVKNCEKYTAGTAAWRECQGLSRIDYQQYPGRTKPFKGIYDK